MHQTRPRLTLHLSVHATNLHAPEAPLHFAPTRMSMTKDEKCIVVAVFRKSDIAIMTITTVAMRTGTIVSRILMMKRRVNELCGRLIVTTNEIAWTNEIDSVMVIQKTSTTPLVTMKICARSIAPDDIREMTKKNLHGTSGDGSRPIDNDEDDSLDLPRGLKTAGRVAERTTLVIRWTGVESRLRDASGALVAGLTTISGKDGGEMTGDDAIKGAVYHRLHLRVVLTGRRLLGHHAFLPHHRAILTIVKTLATHCRRRRWNEPVRGKRGPPRQRPTRRQRTQLPVP